MVLTGLRTNMVYTFYVQARTNKGLGPKAKVTFRTYPAPRAYPNCGAMNRVYPHGVGMAGAVDKTTGTRVRNYLVDARTYRLNDGRVRPNQYDLDRDNDRIACERR
jgi:hypothetical protein